MNNASGKTLLIGDNPFHGISHLSQERARDRIGNADSDVEKVNIVLTAIENGADGFMFSVSDLTLQLLKMMREKNTLEQVELYAIIPYAYEYVRIATQTGTPALAKKIAKQIAISGNLGAALGGLGAVLQMNPKSLLKTYLTYELSRINSAAGKKAKLTSLMLHEVLTDMGLALNLDWLFKSYVSYLSERDITPGFNTRNFPYLVRKFKEWDINLDETVIATQFNKAGFQMNPSREECEKALSNLSRPVVVAISVLAAGYFKPPEAADYLVGLENLKGIAVGASTVKQAHETFALFQKRLKSGH
ncbi:MAG: hypothetical protein NWE99_10705 [Candidatus Bathyarchaeota archaeon]|nr:hypothetical protein [Candidatus Bathyarchaeota archaeon]